MEIDKLFLTPQERIKKIKEREQYLKKEIIIPEKPLIYTSDGKSLKEKLNENTKQKIQREEEKMRRFLKRKSVKKTQLGKSMKVSVKQGISGFFR